MPSTFRKTKHEPTLDPDFLYPPEVPDPAARLARYAEALRAREAFSPVTVGRTRQGYVLLDGRLRLNGALADGLPGGDYSSAKGQRWPARNPLTSA